MGWTKGIPQSVHIRNSLVVMDKCVELYKTGKNVYEIGNELGLHFTTVSKYLNKRGVKTRGHRNYDYALIEKIYTEYVEKGLTMGQVAIKNGLTLAQVKRIISYYGLSRKESLERQED